MIKHLKINKKLYKAYCENVKEILTLREVYRELVKVRDNEMITPEAYFKLKELIDCRIKLCKIE
jgi:hypothetical protein